tara:strand:- start:181 stop:483 length:303 start_codon:yes stop_codon:yes gene_type:complete
MDQERVIKTSSFTFSASDASKNHLVSGSANITGIIPTGLRDKIGFTVTQVGSGAFIPTTGTTAVNIYNRESHTQTAGQYAVATIFSIDTNKYIFGGDTAP